MRNILFIMALLPLLLGACTQAESPRFIFQLPEATVEADKNSSKVWVDSTIEFGGKSVSCKAWVTKGNGEPVILRNNPEAVNPTWLQLINFLKRDSTETHYYSLESISSHEAFVCSDFSELLHNNAETAGWKSGFVSVDFIKGLI